MRFRSRAVFRVCYTTPIRLLKMHYLVSLLLLAASLVSAETIHQGEVVKIADGDTLTLLVDNEQHKIRLSDIDTQKGNSPSAPGQNRRYPNWPLANRPEW